MEQPCRLAECARISVKFGDQSITTHSGLPGKDNVSRVTSSVSWTPFKCYITQWGGGHESKFLGKMRYVILEWPPAKDIRQHMKPMCYRRTVHYLVEISWFAVHNYKQLGGCPFHGRVERDEIPTRESPPKQSGTLPCPALPCPPLPSPPLHSTPVPSTPLPPLCLAAAVHLNAHRVWGWRVELNRPIVSRLSRCDSETMAESPQ